MNESEQKTNHPEISVTIPVYNEEENLPEMHKRLTAALQETGLSYEILFVDDGSRDASVSLISNMANCDGTVRGVFLSRNFGHQPAIAAGIDHARGCAVVLMDCDLQDPPEFVPSLIAKWKEGFEVVYAVRKKRKESWIKRCSYSAFYRILSRIASVDIPLDSGDFSLLDRKVVDLLKRMPERNRFMRGLRSWIGFRQIGLEYERCERHAGKAKYTFKKLLKLALDGFLSFSYVPLRLAFWLGCLSFLVALLTAGWAVYSKIAFGQTPQGWTSLMVLVAFLGGTQLMLAGIAGEYIARIYDEVKQRPYYIIAGTTTPD